MSEAAEIERHRQANLVRAVTNPLWEERDGWIADAVASEDFDAIPWRVAVGLGEKLAAERALADRLAEALNRELDGFEDGEIGAQTHEALAAWQAARHS